MTISGPLPAVPVRIPRKNRSEMWCIVLVAFAALGDVRVVDADVWPRFRGVNGVGTSDLQGLPTQWTEEDYEWVIDLPGVGHSSPVVWEETLFIASGDDTGERVLLCVDALTGEVRWTQKLRLTASHLHKKNSYGSASPAVDGERVYIPFADEGQYLLLAFDFAGNQIWSYNVGTFTSQHGQGVSPIIYEDLVILPNDQQGPSSIVALNRRTGEPVWISPRLTRKTSYSTPMILEREGHDDQLICVSGATGIAGLDPRTGKELWRSGEFPQRTVASPVFAGGLLVASCGQGGRGVSMAWVDPSGAGDVSASHVRHERTTNLPYVPTPIVHGDHLYVWTDDGIVCCVDLRTTENVWRQRIGGNFSGSPVLVDGRLYCVSEEGEVVVIAASPVFQEYGRSPLGDSSYSTPAVANGRMYLRGFHKLACLKAE